MQTDHSFAQRPPVVETRRLRSLRGFECNRDFATVNKHRAAKRTAWREIAEDA